MHGVVLKSLGYDVCIIEARNPTQLRAQATSLSLGPHAQELIETYLPELDRTSYSTATDFTRFVAADGSIISENKTSIPVKCSTWNMVFASLKKEFEKPTEGQGTVQYLIGTKMTGFTIAGDVVTVNYQGNDSDVFKTLTVDLVIAADSAYSTIRKQLSPTIEPKYAGIFAWRGYIREDQIPTKLSAVFDGRLLMFRADGSYVIA